MRPRPVRVCTQTIPDRRPPRTATPSRPRPSECQRTLPAVLLSCRDGVVGGRARSPLELALDSCEAAAAPARRGDVAAR